jgi:tetratricopeptide (TPR) repeat protein
MGLLRAAPATDAQLQRVERWLDAALQRNPASEGLQVALAEFRDVQGRFPEAMKAYRKVLELNPRNTRALNNLAWLLALQQGNTEEAVRLVNRAIDLDGPRAAFLDTLAVIHLRMGQADQAIKHLEEALTEVQDSILWFHLAQAHLQKGALRAAQDAWESAKKLDIHPDRVHPLEREAYERVRNQFEQKT